MLRRSSVGRVLVLVLVLVPALLAAQAGFAGRWDGAIEVMGQTLQITVSLTEEAGALAGTIDIPQQGAMGLRLMNLRAAGETVHFELQAGPGSVALFDGRRTGEHIAGTFEQGSAKGTFSITAAGTPAPARKAEEVPYRQEEVQVVSGGIRLGGTLTLPPGQGPHPAVALLTGSGPQNRDEDVFGMPVFRLLADRLTRAGIAVLRCDDRGVGGSTGNVAQSTSSDFADDALAQVGWLKARNDIDPKRIGLLGHSEGGIVAPMAANRSADVAFVVLLAGPALTGEQVMLAQNELVGRASGVPEAQIRKNGALQRRMFAAVRSGEGLDDVTAEVRDLAREALQRMPEAQRRALGDLDAAAARAAEQQVAGLKTPWFRHFLTYDPAPALEKLACPVLAVFGERDTQVPAGPNREAMEAAFKKGGHRDQTIVVVPRANHLYQDSVTGGPGEYATLKKEFIPGFAETVTNWVVEKTRR
jgi:pimeloyl-ACP methyl ester carboxylesterase